MSDLSQPTVHATAPERLASLRGRAASTLTGPAATKGAAARAADALTVLHALASSPDTASDALTLLHELQVHQVELDLQAHELRESRAELETALRRQIELYDLQPVGCFTIDARLTLHELNESGAGMLGIARDEAVKQSLEAFVCAESARRLRSAVAGVDADMQRASCQLMLHQREGADRQVIASIGKDATANRYLLCLTPAADEQARGATAS